MKNSNLVLSFAMRGRRRADELFSGARFRDAGHRNTARAKESDRQNNKPFHRLSFPEVEQSAGSCIGAALGLTGS